MCVLCVIANKEFHGSWFTDKDFFFIRKINSVGKGYVTMLVADNNTAGSLIIIAVVSDRGALQTHFEVHSCGGITFNSKLTFFLVRLSI